MIELGMEGMCEGADENLLKGVNGKGKGKGKVHHITGHECSEGEYMYSSTLILTSALGGGKW